MVVVGTATPQAIIAAVEAAGYGASKKGGGAVQPASADAAALKDTGMKTLVMAGGVAANSHLRRAVRDMCDSLGVEFVVPSLSLCGDNAAMVAAQGYFELQAGNIAASSLNALATKEIDTSKL